MWDNNVSVSINLFSRGLKKNEIWTDLCFNFLFAVNYDWQLHIMYVVYI